MEGRNGIEKFVDRLCSVEKTFMTILFLIMMSIMFVQVLARYVFKSPLAWTEEVMRFSFIWASFFGGAVATHEHKHVVINFLSLIVSKITQNKQKQDKTYAVFDLLVDISCLVFCTYLTIMMWQYAIELHAKNQLSTAMLLPMWWIAYGIAISFALTSFHFALNSASSFKVLIGQSGEEAKA